MKVITITSPLHRESAADPSKEPFIQSIETLVGERFEFISSDAFSGEDSSFIASDFISGASLKYGVKNNSQLIFFYVRTGGTEGIFREIIQNFAFCVKPNGYGARTHDVSKISHEESGALIRSDFRIVLLTSGQSNSLAASMEILSYLHDMGLHGEILHGTPEYIASGIRELKSVSIRGKNESLVKLDSDSATSGQCYCNCSGSAESFIRKFEPVDLCGARLGVVGKPSDWLISSDVDYTKAREKMNVELVDIPMAELLDCINRICYLKSFVREIDSHEHRCSIASVPAAGSLDMNHSGADSAACVDMRSFRGSEIIYEALKEIVAKYDLKGLTLRCFDLLDKVHNTGCLALARLNAEGIAASCEGDVPALLSMYWLLCKRKSPGFQCNLSKAEGDNLLFAHCTVPLQMVDSYRYMTHFESGIGTAVKGEMPLGKVEIFKIAPDLERYVAIEGEIVSNENKPNLCRTQIVVKAPGAAQYFLHSPLANHHIISYVHLTE